MSTFVGSIFASGTIHNDAPPLEDTVKETEVTADAKEVSAENTEEDAEPEDPAPQIREECAETSACAPLNHHFAHCTERVTSGQGQPHEDCVEELLSDDCTAETLQILIRSFIQSLNPFTTLSLMHCVDNCLAPKLFSKLA
ncbi:uncharacterized protein EI90DRAFT_3122944 [Cantharellus anzutake]|uniref:uncharacterized protein n=1 Tax=Cantharellus anzutake TaxID=1750568 RepID=UPI001904DF89|nr:uncharacterized protein EI90DRAFT_3122944 [Cantharellus anzutake]KAF8331851.1 hypothetical protein EI90DRAFT_3122944 [Cantharellus anzutake]